MKKFTYLFLVFMMLGAFANAQNCEANFRTEIDSSNNVYFIDESTSSATIIWQWDLGDGTNSFEQNPIHQYIDGIYAVCLTIISDDSCSSIYCDSIVIGTGVNTNPCDNAYITYEVSPASTSNSLDGAINISVFGLDTIVGYEWANDQWNSYETTEDIENLSVGYYTVSVYGGIGSGYCTVGETIYVYSNDSSNSGCTASYRYETDSAGVIYFINESTSESEISSWFWNFGDGTTSTEQTPIHTFADGTYTVCLSIISVDSCWNEYCQTIVVGNNVNPCDGFYLTFDITDPSPNSNNGALDVTVFGGTAPYSYLWTGDMSFTASTEDISGLTEGYYVVNVIDNNGCEIEEGINLFYNDSTFFYGCQMWANGIITNVSTEGLSDGAIDVTVYGSNNNYNYYYWNTGATTEDLINISEGTYTLEVYNDDSCYTQSTFYVGVEGADIGNWDSLYVDPVDTCFNFIIDTVFISNYIADSSSVTITWVFAGEGQMTTITLTYDYNSFGYNDVNVSINCGNAKSITSYTDRIFIDESIVLSINNIETIISTVVYPNPVISELNILVNSNKSENINIEIINITGQIINTTNFNTQQGNNNFQIDASNLSNGIYFIKIGDAKIQKFVK